MLFVVMLILINMPVFMLGAVMLRVCNALCHIMLSVFRKIVIMLGVGAPIFKDFVCV